MLFNQNKEYSLHKSTVLFPMDWFGTPIWPPFLCFGTPTWPPWRQVKTLYNAWQEITLTGPPEQLPQRLSIFPLSFQIFSWCSFSFSSSSCFYWTKNLTPFPHEARQRAKLMKRSIWRRQSTQTTRQMTSHPIAVTTVQSDTHAWKLY